MDAKKYCKSGTDSEHVTGQMEQLRVQCDRISFMFDRGWGVE